MSEPHDVTVPFVIIVCVLGAIVFLRAVWAGAEASNWAKRHGHK
jgi:hypothetical protein